MPKYRSKTHSAGVVASTGLLLAQGAAAAFGGTDNVAVYWGQNSYDQAKGDLAQQSLVDYCSNSDIDIIPMAFLVQIETGEGGQPVINLANAGNNCTVFPGTALLDCPQIGEDIQTCQDTYNKTILLSIGGATYTEGGFATEDAAVQAANLIWETFGPADSSAGNVPVTNTTTTSSSIVNTTPTMASVTMSSVTTSSTTITPTMGSATLFNTTTTPYMASATIWNSTAPTYGAGTTWNSTAPTYGPPTVSNSTAPTYGYGNRTAPTAAPSPTLDYDPQNPLWAVSLLAKLTQTDATTLSTRTVDRALRNANPTATISAKDKQEKKKKKSTIYETHTDYATNSQVETIVDPSGTRFVPPGVASSTESSREATTPTHHSGTHSRRALATTALRPFHDAAVDGFDLDIEAPGQNFPAFANRLRALMDAEQSKSAAAKTENPKSYYLTVAPQCPYPDLNNEAMLNGNVSFDAVFVQFYNNYCGVQSFTPNTPSQSTFNFETWHQWATTNSSNPDVKIFIGVPAGATAAGSGYESPANLQPIIEYSRQFSSFGGVMAWDASQAYANMGFLKGVKEALMSAPSTTTATTTTRQRGGGSRRERRRALV